MRNLVVRAVRIVVAVCMFGALMPVVPAGAVPNDNVLPGVALPLRSGPEGSLPSGFPFTDTYDVYWVQLQRDQEITVRWSGSAGLVAEMRILTPSAVDPGGVYGAISTSTDGSIAVVRYKATSAGRHYVVLRRASGSGTYSTYECSISTTHILGKSLYQSPLFAYMDGATAYHRWVLWVRRGRELTIGMTHNASTMLYLDVYTDDGTQYPNSSVIDSNHGAGLSKSVTISAGEWGGGDYGPVYVDVLRVAGAGDYTLFWYTEPDPAYSERISGADRYDVASTLGVYTRWPDDSHVSDVVIASGEDAAAADPLAAGGLCWAYNAPLLLVSKHTSKNALTMIRLQDMEGFSGRVRVHVVGGTTTIPSSVYNQIVAAVGSASDVERIPGANRYDLARNIALRMRDVRSDAEPGVLLANGADSAKFFDALALSSVSAHTGMPVLLVKQNAIPSETAAALASLSSSTPRFLAGGTATVSGTVQSSLGATRWSGPDRYATAAAVAEKAISAGYLGAHNIAIASKLPDALSAGANVGFLGGPIVVVKTDSLPSSTRAYLESQAEICRRLWPVGGPVSIKQSVIDAATNALD